MSDAPGSEHYQKFDALAQRIGVAALKRRIPATAEAIKAALAAGDEHLNTIPLYKWDLAAGRLNRDYLLSFYDPWTPKLANGLSLAERVCVLKHVAKYYI
jgi:hypothetical protein